jgi:hypothetical protein
MTTKGCGIGAVGLVAQDVAGLVRGQQQDTVTLPLDLPRPMVGRVAGLQQNGGGRPSGKKAGIWPRLKLFRSQTRLGWSETQSRKPSWTDPPRWSCASPRTPPFESYPVTPHHVGTQMSRQLTR